MSVKVHQNKWSAHSYQTVNTHPTVSYSGEKKPLDIIDCFLKGVKAVPQTINRHRLFSLSSHCAVLCFSAVKVVTWAVLPLHIDSEWIQPADARNVLYCRLSRKWYYFSVESVFKDIKVVQICADSLYTMQVI